MNTNTNTLLFVYPITVAVKYLCLFLPGAPGQLPCEEINLRIMWTITFAVFRRFMPWIRGKCL